MAAILVLSPSTDDAMGFSLPLNECEETIFRLPDDEPGSPRIRAAHELIDVGHQQRARRQRL
jgi:hypothetical protein